ncbi:MAG: hypothetical protein JKY54_17810, partial [Flavobacteriales bacterium]|nr:hypothetical protein [Flavobacteriales bacterium]
GEVDENLSFPVWSIYTEKGGSSEKGTDYYPFGLPMNGRKSPTNEYRYGFQGQEGDLELYGEGNSSNFSFRMHNPRLGRFFVVDPLANMYSYQTPYAFCENRVIDGIDFEGREWTYYQDSENHGLYHLHVKVKDTDSQTSIETMETIMKQAARVFEESIKIAGLRDGKILSGVLTWEYDNEANPMNDLVVDFREMQTNPANLASETEKSRLSSGVTYCKEQLTGHVGNVDYDGQSGHCQIVRCNNDGADGEGISTIVHMAKTIVHELAHAAGLDHTDEYSLGYIPPAEEGENQDPSKKVYTHVDSKVWTETKDMLLDFPNSGDNVMRDFPPGGWYVPYQLTIINRNLPSGSKHTLSNESFKAKKASSKSGKVYNPSLRTGRKQESGQSGSSQGSSGTD